MSNKEVIDLIDAVLALPVSNSTKENLHSFRAQAINGVLSNGDHNYVIALCERLQRGRTGTSRYPELKQYPAFNDTRERAAQPDIGSAAAGVLALVGGGFFLILLTIGGWLLAALLVYGVIVIIFRYAFGVELWNPFN